MFCRLVGKENQILYSFLLLILFFSVGKVLYNSGLAIAYSYYATKSLFRQRFQMFLTFLHKSYSVSSAYRWEARPLLPVLSRHRRWSPTFLFQTPASPITKCWDLLWQRCLWSLSVLGVGILTWASWWNRLLNFSISAVQFQTFYKVWQKKKPNRNTL